MYGEAAAARFSIGNSRRMPSSGRRNLCSVADELRVRVDQDLCTGDGLCVQYAPQVFEFDVDGLAYVKDADGELQLASGTTVPVPADVVAAVIDSAIECPGECIHVTDASGTAVAGPEFVGMPQVPSRLSA
jgi:ferredoxin